MSHDFHVFTTALEGLKSSPLSESKDWYSMNIPWTSHSELLATIQSKKRKLMYRISHYGPLERTDPSKSAHCAGGFWGKKVIFLRLNTSGPPWTLCLFNL